MEVKLLFTTLLSGQVGAGHQTYALTTFPMNLKNWIKYAQ